MDRTDPNTLISPYRRGADDGFIFGIYLSAMFFSSIFAPKLPLLGLLSFVLMIAVPVVIFLFIRRYDRRLGGCATFPMMWMEGVVTFICGMLIAGALLVVYMKWLNPDFIREQLEGLVELGKQTKGTTLTDVGDVAQQMLDANFIPSPIGIVTELIMLAVVSGSFLSIIISAGFTLVHKNRRNRGPQC